jgi:hypothetical protein
MRRLHPRPAPVLTAFRLSADTLGRECFRATPMEKLQSGGLLVPDPFAVFSRLPFASLRVRVFLADGPIKDYASATKATRGPSCSASLQLP